MEAIMMLTDMELMHQYAEDDSPQKRLGRQRLLESWIAAGCLTPEETHEAGRVLKLLRERGCRTKRAT
jgi:hypothetical protein